MVFSSHMGCGGNLLMNFTSLKKSKGGGRRWKKGYSKKAESNMLGCEFNSKKASTIFDDATCDSNGNRWILGCRIEDVAATKIQTSFRAFLARKRLRQLKRSVRLNKIMAYGDSRKKQVISTLNHFHMYSKVQDQIKARRLCMVVESRLRQKKIENQSKVDTKLHEVETEWSCSSKSVDEMKAKIHIREEEAIKRERALSYALNHQWRANVSQKQLMGNSEIGKSDWGWSWSWRERWIAARPWESPLVTTSKNEPSSPTFNIDITKTKVTSTPSKSSSPRPTTLSGGKSSTPRHTFSSGKRVVKPQRRLHFPSSNKSSAKKDYQSSNH